MKGSTPLRRLSRWLEQAYWCLLIAVGSGGFQNFEGLGRLAWIGADAFVVLCFVYAPSRYLLVSARAWPLYLWPALAITSSLWSLAPGLSVYHGLQLAATVMVGVVLFERWGLAGTIRLVFFSLVLSICVSFLIGRRDQFGALVGFFGHKNQLGASAVTLFYTSVVMYYFSWRRLSVFGALVAVAAVVSSRSGTATICLMLSGCTLAMAAIWIASRQIFFIALAMAATLIAGAVLFASIYDIAIIDAILRLLGKDSTLTGRTVLWRYGWLSFMDNFWLGVGYKAYMASSLTTSTLIQYILQQRLPYLHNNWLDVAADLGVVGLVVFASVVCAVVIRTLAAFLRHRTMSAAWALCFLGNLLTLSFAEGALFYNHSIGQALFVVVYLSTCHFRPSLIPSKGPFATA